MRQRSRFAELTVCRDQAYFGFGQGGDRRIGVAIDRAIEYIAAIDVTVGRNVRAAAGQAQAQRRARSR